MYNLLKKKKREKMIRINEVYGPHNWNDILWCTSIENCFMQPGALSVLLLFFFSKHSDYPWKAEQYYFEILWLRDKLGFKVQKIYSYKSCRSPSHKNVAAISNFLLFHLLITQFSAEARVHAWFIPRRGPFFLKKVIYIILEHIQRKR